jgi:hypothetical protein
MLKFHPFDEPEAIISPDSLDTKAVALSFINNNSELV